jgi:hypothetical protein
MALHFFEHHVILPTSLTHKLLHATDHTSRDGFGNVLHIPPFTLHQQSLEIQLGVRLGLITPGLPRCYFFRCEIILCVETWPPLECLVRLGDGFFGPRRLLR